MATYAAATGGKRSGSSSSVATASGHYILRIHGYAGTKQGTPTGEYIKSQPFTVGGHRWSIRYYPNGYGPRSSDHISFFLKLGESVAKAVRAQYQFRFVDQEEENPLASEPVTSFERQTISGYAKFINKEEFDRSEHLRDDGSFALRCDIAVIGDDVVRVEATASASVDVPASGLHQHLGDLLGFRNLVSAIGPANDQENWIMPY